MSHEPDFNTLSALADHRLEADERRRLLEHLADCPECRDLLSLLVRHTDTGPAATWWHRRAIWLPMAASLAVAAIGTVLATMPRRTAGVPAAPPTAVPRPTQPSDTTEPAPPPASPPATVQPGDRPASSPPGGVDGRVRRRGAVREAGGKTFRLVAGEWLDSSYDPGALLPVVDLTSTESRRAALLRMPALEAYAALGDRVTVVYEGTVYRFAPP